MSTNGTVVTITPLKVRADSRTFKQANSMKRFGFISVVIEAEGSHYNTEHLHSTYGVWKVNPRTIDILLLLIPLWVKG